MAEGITRIQLNGADIGYSVHGAGAGKPSLIFAHGGGLRSTGELYTELLDGLAEGYAVYALDLRGHGASAGAIDGWSLVAIAEDVVAFSQALGLNRPVFVGHSLGAFTGLFAESRHPGSFSAVCLLSPRPADVTRDPLEALDALIEHGRNREIMSVGFGHMFVRPPGRMLDLMLDAVTLVDPGVFRSIREQNTQVSLTGQLQGVTVPTLLICGERDTVVAPARQHDMARKLPRCKEVVFSSEGHMLPNESPAIAVREILAFLEHDRSLMAAAPLFGGE